MSALTLKLLCSFAHCYLRWIVNKFLSQALLVFLLLYLQGLTQGQAHSNSDDQHVFSA